ncbi:hypothetical protein MRS44_004996 [Fusarium solani]|uniref:uncharacterized protein n=1 Tax=Fusarium solani TaxID=169388 RepID=UPI0032C40186|nr:hypothetical protein MRS44_004996 [Fusarium solani]
MAHGSCSHAGFKRRTALRHERDCAHALQLPLLLSVAQTAPPPRPSAALGPGVSEGLVFGGGVGSTWALGSASGTKFHFGLPIQPRRPGRQLASFSSLREPIRSGPEWRRRTQAAGIFSHCHVYLVLRRNPMFTALLQLRASTLPAAGPRPLMGIVG